MKTFAVVAITASLFAGLAHADDVNASERHTDNFVTPAHVYSDAAGATRLGAEIQVNGQRSIYYVDQTPGLSRSMVLSPDGAALKAFASAITGKDLAYKAIHVTGANS